MGDGGWIGSVASLIAVGGAAIYTLGLVAVGWPIYRGVTGGSGKQAWYALTLIPRSVVVGHGIRAFFSTPFLMILLLVPLSLLLGFLDGVLPAERMDIPLSIIGVALVVACMYALLNWTVTEPFFVPLRNPSWKALLVGVALSLPPLYIAATGITVYLEFDPLPTVVDWSGIYISAVFFLIGAFLVGLPFAIASDPPLLKVVVFTLWAPQVKVAGKLIAHADGVWHFFDEQGNLTAIPDENVRQVRIGG